MDAAPPSSPPLTHAPTMEDAPPFSASKPAMEDSIEALLAMLRWCGSSESFKQLQNMQADKLATEEALHQLQVAYNANLTALAKKEAELRGVEDDLAGERDTVARLTGELEEARETIARQDEDAQAKAAQIAEQQQNIEDLVAQIKEKDERIAYLETVEAERDRLLGESSSTQQTLETRDAELASTLDTLATVESFVVKLEGLQSQKDQICEALGTMFSEAYTFMEESFAPDLEASCLAEASIWDAVRSHPSIQHSIPIPSSNTPAAKRMRAAAALILYSRALAKYIWRPTYITRETDLDKTLAQLESQDPLHEAYARAVMLKIQPDRQTACRQSCVKYVVNDFLEVMGCLVPPEGREAFAPGLKQLSDKISLAWLHVQKLQEKVRPSFHFNFLEEWQPMPQMQGESQSGDESTARVVWPTFLYTNSEHETEELLHHGYTITYGQIGDAEKEVSRRAVRKSMRLNEQAIAGNKKRRDSGIFLSHGPLLSSPVK